MQDLTPKYIVAVFALLLSACDGGSNGNGGNTPPPQPSPGPQNPCATALDAGFDAALERGAPAPALDKPALDHSTRWRVLDDIYLHRAAVARRGLQPAAPPTAAVDVGEVAVLQDQGDLILPANRFDLRSAGLRFSRNGSGGYDVIRITAAFRGTLGSRFTLADDDSRSATLPFPFPFYGRAQTAAFVNSDGNVTFEEEDRASTDRNVSRLLTGPPRVSPFLADLDPSVAGSVWVNATNGEFTVTWCNVRGFESTQIATVQTTLLSDGTIEMQFDGATTLLDAVVGLSPGRTGEFQPVDLSMQGPTPGGSAAVGERFSEMGELDTVATARRFYTTHGDLYDQLVIWTDTRVVSHAFAFESTVANQIRGIGVDQFDISRDFGSAGRLNSIVVMDALTKYPGDPLQKFLRENSTVALLGHETGHRWLAALEFRDHEGRRSQALLGRDQVHWSFFFDSDASFMEGNDIEDLGGGAFRTKEVVSRYSRLDLYAMGLVREGDVPPMFYVGAPVNTSRQASDPPELNVTMNGTKRDVLLNDVIAIHGPRAPAADVAPRLHRQAFVYVIRTADPAAGQVSKIDRIRRAWEPYFQTATGRRMRVETRLNP